MPNKTIETKMGAVRVGVGDQYISIQQKHTESAKDPDCIIIPTLTWSEVNAAVLQLVAEHKRQKHRSKLDETT